MNLRTRWRDTLLRRLDAGAQAFPVNDLPATAIIFSPHFDDETLGCGGLMIKKKRAHATVKIVFMTDGSQSHAHLVAPEELAKMRRQEGLDAARVLGLNEADVYTLSFSERQLEAQMADAITAVTQILSDVEPAQVFIPYSGEPRIWSHDHQATTAIIYAALKRHGRPVTVYEYPIWFWYSLPWMNLADNSRRNQLRILGISLSSWFGLRVVRDFSHALDIADVLDQKIAALKAHRSQMERLQPDVGWPILSDMSNGQFLARLTAEREYYRLARREP